MAKKKEYRSSIRSRRMIQEAFLKLLEEKELSKITVTDIVKTADLNRSTFYAHYPDIFALYDDLMQSVIHRCLEALETSEHNSILSQPKIYLSAISATLEEYRHLYKKLGHSEDIHRMLDVYRQRMAQDIVGSGLLPEAVCVEPLLSIRINFFVGGIMNTYQQWLEGNLNCSLEQINDEIASLISKSAEDIIGSNANP